jgi:hypothetical protein
MFLRLLAICFICLFLFSLYGWGVVARRFLRLPAGPWPLTVSFGLSILIFLGGILNVARLAGPPALVFLFLAGLVAWFPKAFAFLRSKEPLIKWWRPLPPPKESAGKRESKAHPLDAAITDKPTPPPASIQWYPQGWKRMASFPILLFVLFTGLFYILVARPQLPSPALNYHDDYQKYCAYPVRMLQTGSLSGNPLSALGSESLGGESFLQGFLLLLFPIFYIQAMDGVLGFFLCLCLAFTLPPQSFRRDLLPFLVLSLLAIVLIDPEWINVSALYLGSALILAQVSLTLCHGESPDAWPPPVALGLIGATLVALKPTFVLFVFLHLFAVGLVLCLQRAGAALRWLMAAVLSLLGFLLPWLLLYAPCYWAAFVSPIALLQVSPVGRMDSLRFFSFAPLPFGSAMFDYTFLLLVVCCLALMAFFASRSGPIRRSATMLLAASGAAFACYLLILLVMAPRLYGHGVILRYYVPILIGVAPAVLVFAPHYMDIAAFRSRLPWALLFMFGLAPLAFFVPGAAARFSSGLSGGTLYATLTPASVATLRYCHDVAFGPVRGRVETAQALVPPGEPLLAWINAPFYLDYRRNPIFSVELAGLGTPWARVPSVRYVLWQYRDPATRPLSYYQGYAFVMGTHERFLAAQGLRFTESLHALLQGAKVLYQQNGFVLYRLSTGAPGTR